jgi:hypothetical protein
MKENMLSYDLSDEVREKINTALNTLTEGLEMLASLSEEDLRSLAKPNAARLEAALKLIPIVENNPGLYPPAIVDPQEAKRDAALLDLLQHTQQTLEPIVTRLSHTQMMLRSDLYRFGLNVRQSSRHIKARLTVDERAQLDAFEKTVNPR